MDFMTAVRSHGVTALALITLLTACSDPPVPSLATPTGSSTVSATVASAVGTIPSVRITDAKGKGVKKVLVRWRVTSGGGKVINDTIRTNASGEASAGGWTLGTVAGVQTLEASTDGVPAAIFTAQAAPGPVVQLTRVTAESQKGIVNTLVTAPPAVRAEDMYANPVPGVPVVFSIALGTGSLTGEQQTTNGQGVATVGGWRLGTQAGQQLVRAATAGTSGAVFSVTAEAGPPAELVKIAGDDQQSVSGLPVNVPPGVRVVDAFANPVGNVPVSFTPGTGSGSVSGATLTTDPATGAAFVGSWTLGSAATQTLVASSSQLPGKNVTFTAKVVQSLFDIDVRFIGDGGTTVVRNAFLSAAAKWRSIIVGDLHNTRLNANAATCASWIPAISETANDVIIYARIGPIDGAGTILGQASPCIANSSTNLTAVGLMEFDEDDMPALIANGSLTDVIVHEMGHVLGIGTMWNYRRQLLSGSGSSDPFFTGTAARAQFAAINTTSYSGNPVPVENTGGGGTRDSHWRENILGRELMTGFLNRNVPNPLSRLSAGSLQDLGYLINISGADPYSITASIRYSIQFGLETPLALGDDIKHDTPLYEAQPDGSLRLVKAAMRR